MNMSPFSSMKSKINYKVSCDEYVLDCDHRIPYNWKEWNLWYAIRKQVEMCDLSSRKPKNCNADDGESPTTTPFPTIPLHFVRLFGPLTVKVGRNKTIKH